MNPKLHWSIYEVSETTKTDKKVEQSAENAHETKEVDQNQLKAILHLEKEERSSVKTILLRKANKKD